MRKAKVYMHDQLAGILVEDEEGYLFSYDAAYLQRKDAEAVSLTLSISEKTYQSPVLFPFFDGLIPEGWLLEIAERNWKLTKRDRMGLLLACCHDCIGAVSIIEEKEEHE
jgi:serine/threonine-protein kinase HipA